MARWWRSLELTSIPLSVFNPAASASFVRGETPIPDDHEVAVDHPPVAGPDPLHGAVAFEALDPRAGEQLHAVLDMDVAVDRADLRAEHALQRHR